MKKYKFFVFLLFFQQLLRASQLRTVSRILQNTTTPGTARSDQLIKQCSTTNRADLYRKYGQAQPAQFSTTYSKYFPIDQTVLDEFLWLRIGKIHGILFQHSLGYALFIAPIFAMTLLAVLSAPVMYILLFCPMRACLRKKLAYSSNEKLFPVVVSILFGLGILATCTVGLLSNYKLYSGYKQLTCSGTIIFDDALYGNLSQSQPSFFSGSKAMASDLSTVLDHQKEIYGYFSRVGPNNSQIASAITLISEAINPIQAIPGDQLQLTYSSPLLSQNPSNTLSSTFPPILGNRSQNNSLVAGAYSAVINAKQSLQNFTSKVNSLLVTETKSEEYISQVVNDANQTSENLFQSLLTINDIFRTFQPSSVTLYLEGFVYGGIIVLVGLLCLSITCLVKWQQMWCRHCMYLFGFFLFFATLIVLGISLLLVLASAVSYSSCNYLDKTFSSPSEFVNNFVKLGVDASVARQFSVCLKGQSGDFVDSMSGTQVSRYMGTLNEAMIALTSLKTVSLSDSIETAYRPLQTQLLAYSQARVLDITDERAINDLKHISNPGNYASCKLGNFQSDSWIPSLGQLDNAIPCMLTGNTGFSGGDNSTCKNTNSFQSAAQGCTGCMDTSSLLYSYTTKEEVLNILNSRYADCYSFNIALANLWSNFYLIKKNSLQPVLQKEVQARQAVDNAKQALNGIDPMLSSTISNLYLSSKGALNPQIGVIAGLNCKVIGQDIALFKNTLCRNTFSYSFFHQILTLVIGCSLLLLLCCNTCTLFRQRRQILGSANAPDNNKIRAEAESPQTAGRLQNPYI